MTQPLSVFCCLRGCLDGFKFNPTVAHPPKENPIQLDTAFMGYEVVIVKGGQRVCGAGAALGNAPLVQSKAYFEVKIQQSGTWSVGIATRQTDLSLTQGGMDEFSWTLGHDHIIRHNKMELYKVNMAQLYRNDFNNKQLTDEDSGELHNLRNGHSIQEGDIIGVAFDHIQLKFFINGREIDHAVLNIKGTVYPALYVDDGAILDIILDNFNFSPPSGFDKIMLEQSLL